MSLVKTAETADQETADDLLISSIVHDLYLDKGTLLHDLEKQKKIVVNKIIFAMGEGDFPYHFGVQNWHFGVSAVNVASFHRVSTMVKSLCLVFD